MLSALLLFPTPWFCSRLFKTDSWVYGLFVSLVQNLPQMCMHTVPCSPLRFLCILLLEERCVRVQARQHCSTGLRVPACVTWRSLPTAPSLQPPTASSQGILPLHLLLPCQTFRVSCPGSWAPDVRVPLIFVSLGPDTPSTPYTEGVLEMHHERKCINFMASLSSPSLEFWILHCRLPSGTKYTPPSGISLGFSSPPSFILAMFPPQVSPVTCFLSRLLKNCSWIILVFLCGSSHNSTFLGSIFPLISELYIYNFPPQ